MSEISPETIEAAAERLHFLASTMMDASSFCPSLSHAEANSRRVGEELGRMANAINSRLAADRAEREERARPIDAEWLESIGCKKMAINRWKIQEQIRVNVWLVECVRWMVRIDGWLVQMHTRGQLLDLLRVLKGGDA